MAVIERHVRWYQQPLRDYLLANPSGRAIEIAHRRWGKDEMAMQITFELSQARAGTYWHCLPNYSQARKAIWNQINAHTGRRRIDEMFPLASRKRTLDQEMMIEFKNGSTWQLIGSDRYDATVGAGPVGIVYSEWALANPSAWGYHRPMLQESGGFAMFITTPRGRNHAHGMYEHAVKSPHWFAELSGVQHTHALTREQLLEAHAELSAMHGEEMATAMVQQEYFCSFNAAIIGAIYSREMINLRSSGRVGPVLYDPRYPVHRAWDIGVRDDTSIIFFQVRGSKVYILDAITRPGGHVELFAEWIEKHGYNTPGSVDLVPHDARVKEWGTGRSRVETMRLYGLNPEVVPQLSKLDGIQAARQLLKHVRISDISPSEGGQNPLLPALEQYRREWDDTRKIFKMDTVHDWTSHLSDAFRYLAVGYQEIPEPEPIKKTIIQPGQIILPGIQPASHGGRRYKV